MANTRRRPTGAVRKPPVKAAPKKTDAPAPPEQQATTDVESEYLDTTPEGPNPVDVAGAPENAAEAQPAAVSTPSEADVEATTKWLEAEKAWKATQVQEDHRSQLEKDQDELAELDETEYRQFWTKYLQEQKVVRPPNGRILYPGEPITFVGNRKYGNVVELSEDLYQLVVPRRTRRPTFTLLARAGSVISQSEVVDKDGYLEVVSGLISNVQH